MIIWITGLAAAGKTTIGTAVYRIWKEVAVNTVFFDGDEIREVLTFNNMPNRYSIESRHQIGQQYSDLCGWLDRQGINVVCATICNFEDILQNNRNAFSKYFQVFVSVPFDVLIERDTKNLYRRALAGQLPDVVGVDIPFEEPIAPDMVIDNSQSGLDHEITARTILCRAGILAELK